MLRRLDETSLAAPARSGAAHAGASPARRRSRAAFFLFLVASVLIPLVLFGFAAWRDWHEVEREGRERVATVRDALAGHALSVFTRQRLVAAAVEDRIRGLTWDEVAQSAELAALLKEVGAGLPEVHGILLVDPAGTLRRSSREVSAPAQDLSGAAWFRATKAAAEPVTVHPREAGQVVPDELFALAFRRTAPDGAFDGAIRIAVAPAWFDAFGRGIARDDTAALVRRDGALLARRPEPPAQPGALDLSSPLLARIAERDEDVLWVRSPVDGRRRLTGYAKVADWPVYAAYGADEDDLVRRWTRRLEALSLTFIPAALGLLILAFQAWRAHDDLTSTVEARTRELRGAVAEREQLLKEVHHRVKNNMQIISSLIRMQERVGTSPDETIRRVQAMALVHDLIYTQGEFAGVDLGAYANRLVEALRAGPAHGIAFTLDLHPVSVALDRAMPFALVLSEVVTNAIRHAFKERRGTIEISLSEAEGSVKLRVHDDGFGFNPEVDGRGFGLRLVQSLAVQLDATFSFDRQQGTTFSMTFPVTTPQKTGAALA
jgi:two-component sensor histidine kinase